MLELGHVAFRIRLRLGAELAQEAKHFRGCAGHLGNQRYFRIARVAQKSGRLAPELENTFDQGGVVPFGIAEFARARGIRAIERFANPAIVGVLRDREIAWHVQRQLPPGFAVGLRGELRRRQHVVGHAGKRAFIGDKQPVRIRRIEHVVLETRGASRKLFLYRLEARFLVVGQLRPGEPKVTQRIFDELALRAISGECGRRCEVAIPREKTLVVGNVGVERGDLRQVCVVGFPQGGRVDHGIQMRDLPPGAIEPVERVGKRLNEVVPARRVSRARHTLDRFADIGDQGVDRGRHVARLDLGKTRQPGKIQQRVVACACDRGAHAAGLSRKLELSSRSRSARSAGVPMLNQRPLKHSPVAQPRLIQSR